MMIESIGWYTNDGDPHPYFWDGWSGWGLGTDQEILQGAGDLKFGDASRGDLPAGTPTGLGRANASPMDPACSMGIP